MLCLLPCTASLRRRRSKHLYHCRNSGYFREATEMPLPALVFRTAYYRMV